MNSLPSVVRGETTEKGGVAQAPALRQGPAIRRPVVDRPRSSGRLALVSAPFNSYRRPSIQLGLLAAIAREAGWQVKTHHLFLDFAAMIGEDLYERVANDRGLAVGDWLFSVAAFGTAAPDADGSRLTRDSALRDEQALLGVRRDIVPRFVALAAAEIARARPEVVGFTSTFQQTAASIAIAIAVKRLLPGVRILFGGANFEHEMAPEWLANVPAIDLILSGEADDGLPLLLSQLARRGALEDVPGLSWRDDGALRQNPAAALVTDLDRNPVPDYEEYFARARYLGLMQHSLRNDIRLPFESARGCWWGETHHCTFCGLNALSMKFRAKTADRVLDELGALAARNGSFHFEAVDNIIDRDYRKTLLPRLSQPDTTYDIFYEVKSNLKPDELAELARAGVRSIQPGIESLSSNVLKLMHKGVRGLQNVNLLRWSLYYGISVSWNVLWGFPGERAEDYEQQAQLFGWLHHLQPPSAGLRIWLERFSPLYKNIAKTDRCRPERGLDFILPQSIAREKVAYFFEYALADSLPDSAFAGMAEAIALWKAAWSVPERPRLVYYSAPDAVTVEDSRNPETARILRYTGREARVFQAVVRQPQSAGRVAEMVEAPLHLAERSLRLLARDGVVVSEDGLHLAAPIPARRR